MKTKDIRVNYGLITGLFIGFVGGGFITMLILMGGYQPNITPQERHAICFKDVVERYAGEEVTFSVFHDYHNDTAMCTVYVNGKVDSVKVIDKSGNIK